MRRSLAVLRHCPEKPPLSKGRKSRIGRDLREPTDFAKGALGWDVAIGFAYGCDSPKPT